MSSTEEHKLLTFGKHNRSFRLICTVQAELSSVVPSVDDCIAPGVPELASKTICSLVTTSAALLVNSVSSYSLSCTVCDFRWNRTKR